MQKISPILWREFFSRQPLRRAVFAFKWNAGNDCVYRTITVFANQQGSSAQRLINRNLIAFLSDDYFSNRET